jgi:hypothetical protein
MKIPREKRDMIKIVDIWNSNKQDWDILYVKMESYEDVATVTSHAKNIDKVAEGQTQKKMLNYIPREFHARFDYLENLSKKIRKESKGQLQTNTRKGRLDFIYRIRNKDNKNTPWKEITPSIIPAECPIFELDIMKNKHKTNQKNYNITNKQRIPLDQTINNDITNQIRTTIIDDDDYDYEQMDKAEADNSKNEN